MLMRNTEIHMAKERERKATAGIGNRRLTSSLVRCRLEESRPLKFKFFVHAQQNTEEERHFEICFPHSIVFTHSGHKSMWVLKSSISNAFTVWNIYKKNDEQDYTDINDPPIPIQYTKNAISRPLESKMCSLLSHDNYSGVLLSMLYVAKTPSPLPHILVYFRIKVV